MAKISLYPTGTPTDNAYVIGNEAAGPTTQRFLFSAIWTYISGKLGAADLEPDTTSTRKLGSATKKYSEVHTDALVLGGTSMTAAALADPNADRMLFWDDSASAVAYLTPGDGLAIFGTSMAVDTTIPRTDPTGVTGADAITNILTLTTAEYAAIGTKNGTTIYIITDA